MHQSCKQFVSVVYSTHVVFTQLPNAFEPNTHCTIFYVKLYLCTSHNNAIICSNYNTGWPLSRQCAIPWQGWHFPDASRHSAC